MITKILKELNFEYFLELNYKTQLNQLLMSKFYLIFAGEHDRNLPTVHNIQLRQLSTGTGAAPSGCQSD